MNNQKFKMKKENKINERILAFLFDKEGTNPLIANVLLKVLQKSPAKIEILKKVYQKNLMLMHLLSMIGNFQLAIWITREKFKIPITGFETLKEYQNWLDEMFLNPDVFLDSFVEVLEKTLTKNSLVLARVKNEITSLKTKSFEIKFEYLERIFKEQIEGIVETYHLPYNFLPCVANYVLFNKIDAPYLNWNIEFEPKQYVVVFSPVGKLVKNIEKETRHRIGLKNTKSLILKIYSPLTLSEIGIIKEVIKELSKRCFPLEFFSEIKYKKNIKNQIEILKRMPKRRKEKKELKEYLKLVKERYGEKELKETIKRWKSLGENIYKKVEGYTSKDIAREIFGSEKKDYLVRKIYSGLKKRAMSRFFGIK